MVPLGFMDDHLAQNLWSIVRHYKGRLFIGLLLVFISNLLLLLNPLILRQALLIFSSHALEQEGLGSILHSFLGSYTYSLMAWVILLLSVASLSALLKYYMRIIFITIGREVEVSVREKMFQRIQSQSKGFFDRHGIGDLLSRLTNDISAYRDLLGPGLMYPVFFVTLIIPAVAVLFTLSPLMAWVSLIPIVVIYLFHFGIRSALYQLSHHVQELLGEMSVMVHEHFSGIRLIKSYGIEQATSKLFQKLCQRFSQMNLRLTCLQGFVFPVLSLVTRLVTVALVLLAGALILLHWQPLNLADFLAFMWIQSYMFGPLLMLGWVLPMYQRGQAAYHRLVEIYQEPLEVQDQPGALSAIPLNASIECRDLTFTYPKQTTPTLNHINLKIEGGSFIGLTGPVGAGKTTLLRLLNREYEIPRGKILIDGRDIHDYRLQAFHQAMITVDQLPFLFSQTIGNNIVLVNQKQQRKKLKRLLNKPICMRLFKVFLNNTKPWWESEG